MKKKVTALCLCVALLAVAVVGASLAYFTDTKSATNTFTVGNVKINLLESSLHRENAGVANGATSTSELWSDVAKEGSGNTSKYKAGDSFYTDAQIEKNAAEYTLLCRVYKQILKLLFGIVFFHSLWYAMTTKGPVYFGDEL